MKNRILVSLFSALVLATLVQFAPATAQGEVLQLGTWPAEERVSLVFDAAPRREAVKKLAQAAGWSLVAEGLGEVPVSVDVREQPAEKVLVLLLAGGEFVVERDGNLVSVRPQATPSAHSDGSQAQNAVVKPGEDLFVNEEARVGRDQVVRDLFVVGSVIVEGTVTGSVVVFGGKAQFVRGARVSQDVIAFGGSIDIEDGVEIGGDVAALFGTLRRGDGPSRDCVTCTSSERDSWQEFWSDVFSHLTNSVLVWLLGALALAAAASRVNVLREEVERRPLRTLGVGVAVFGGALLLIVTLVFTLVGIPLAVLSAVVGVAVTYVAFSALPLAVGRKLAARRSANPYVHLAVGCVVLFLVQCIPVVGALVSLAGAFMALGALFSTRAAGFFKRTAAANT